MHILLSSVTDGESERNSDLTSSSSLSSSVFSAIGHSNSAYPLSLQRSQSSSLLSSSSSSSSSLSSPSNIPGHSFHNSLMFAQRKFEYLIDLLRKKTKYTVVVQAFNSKGAGPSSPELTVETFAHGKILCFIFNLSRLEEEVEAADAESEMSLVRQKRNRMSPYKYFHCKCMCMCMCINVAVCVCVCVSSLQTKQPSEFYP